MHPSDGHSHDKSLGAELVEHLPYTVASAVVSIFLATIGASVMPAVNLSKLFHVFHPAHVLLSATATTAMFWLHKRSVFKAIVVGTVGALALCSLSDILFPFIGGAVLAGGERSLHLCIIEHPFLIIPFNFIGVFMGIFAADHIRKSTFYSHSGHVFLSTAASTFYVITYSLGENWVPYVGWILVVITVSVVIPCVISDIVLPLLLVNRKEVDG